VIALSALTRARLKTQPPNGSCPSSLRQFICAAGTSGCSRRRWPAAGDRTAGCLGRHCALGPNGLDRPDCGARVGGAGKPTTRAHAMSRPNPGRCHGRELWLSQASVRGAQKLHSSAATPNLAPGLQTRADRPCTEARLVDQVRPIIPSYSNDLNRWS
jgi:hypothetical protein